MAPSNTPAGRNPEQEPPAKAGARVEGSSLGIGLIGGLVFARENSPAEQTGQLDVQITRQWDGLWDQMELLHASLYITGAQAIAKPASRQSQTNARVFNENRNSSKNGKRLKGLEPAPGLIVFLNDLNDWNGEQRWNGWNGSAVLRWNDWNGSRSKVEPLERVRGFKVYKLRDEAGCNYWESTGCALP